MGEYYRMHCLKLNGSGYSHRRGADKETSSIIGQIRHIVMILTVPGEMLGY